MGILDFVFDDNQNDPTFLHIVELKDSYCRVFYDKLKFIYIELPKFRKTLEELQTHFDKWLFLFRNLPQLYEPPQSLQEEVFEQLFEVAEIANFTVAENRSYQASLKVYRDWYAIEMTARSEARQQGREEGAKEKALSIARSLLGVLDIETISQTTGLSVAEIEQLQK